MRHRSSLCLAAVAAIVSGGAAGAGSAEPEAWVLAKSAECVACHGAGGIAPNPTFPSLAGQNAGYLELQLKRFRSGERYHQVMTPIAESLSDGDIDALALYYSRLALPGDARNIR